MSENDPPTKLNYSSINESGGGRVVSKAILGAIATALFSAVLIGMILAYGINAGGVGLAVSILASLVYVGLAVALGRKLYLKPKHRGWGLGIWIGLGLAALLEGACFMSLSHI